MNTAAWRALNALALVLVVGCASVDTSPPTAVGEIRAAQPTPPELQFSGRLSLRIRRTSDGATDGGSLLFEFQGSERQGSLLLLTPIGTTLARAQWSPSGAEIHSTQGNRRAPTLDEAVAPLLGETLPLAALMHWIRAEPWGGAPVHRHGDGFEQLGWSISLSAWHEGLITASRAPRPERAQDTEIIVRARLDEPPARGAAPR